MDRSQEAGRGFFQFAEHMRDVAAIISVRDRRFRFLNAAAERVFGVAREEIFADAALPYRLISEEQRPQAIAFLKQAAAEGSASAEFRICRNDGTECWLAARAFPLENDGDEPLCAFIGEDVTESKRYERALSENEARLRQVAENIDEVFWIAAPDGTRIHYVSPAYENIWKRPAADLYTSPFKWIQAIHPEDQPRVLETVTLRQAERPLEIQFRIERGGGDTGYIRHRSVPIRDAGGQVVHVACMSEDVTEQKRFELQAEESARAQRDALVREVHHRIKNNLQGVTGMLRNYANEHAEVSAVINEAIAQVQAVAIIYGLQGRPGMARVMLDDILKEVVSGIGQLMHRGMDFHNEEARLGCRVVVSEAEAVPIALVLNEMVFNAVKHGSADAELAVELKIDIARERATLTVANGGKLADGGDRPLPGGSGLQLIRSLLPRRGAYFELSGNAAGVVAKLTLEPPIVTLKC